ncbi:aldehyde dehydrogenase family protein [Nocardia fluminea]|uniref:aldehyde dehydrogenase family protein n=1 Tax=Nocardia fluminea TaxID=134984 RepID=UPI003D0AAD70
MSIESIEKKTVDPTVRQHSFGSYLAGTEISGSEWVHVPLPRALMDDSFSSLSLKRRLDTGEIVMDESHANLIVGRVALADIAIVERGLEAAHRATKEWRAVPLGVRIDKFLTILHERFVQKSEELEYFLGLEGHPRELARWERTSMLLSTSPESRAYFRDQMWHEIHHNDRRNIVRRLPDGVVTLNPPANAPMASVLLAGLSLAAGNAVVARAPRSSPLGVMWAVNELLGYALAEVGAPAGCLSAFCGDPQPMLDAWLASPYVNDIMYFGSSENGLSFERKCVESQKKPILELAGNDIVVVWRDANLDHAATALLEGFFGSGQLCMIPNQVVLHPDIADALIEKLVAKTAELYPGYPDEDGVLLSPVLRHEKFYKFLEDAVGKGAELIVGGHGIALDGTRDSAGFFLEPTIIRIDGLADSRRIDAVKYETFFPLLPLVVIERGDDDDLLATIAEFINTNLYGLRNSIWAKDQGVIDYLIANIVNGGLLVVNASHIAFGATVPSHGGTGLTGGVSGEANHPGLRTTHVQGLIVADGDTPPIHR